MSLLDTFKKIDTAFSNNVIVQAVKKVTDVTTPLIASTSLAILPKINTIPKALGVISAPIAVNALASSPQLRKDVVTNIPKVVNAPSELGKDIGSFYQNPSLEGATKILTENKGILGATALATGVLGAGGLLTVANIASTRANTKAIKDSVNLSVKDGIGEISKVSGVGGVIPTNSTATIPSTSLGSSEIPLTPPTQVLGKEANTTRSRRRNKRTSKSGQSSSVKVNVYNRILSPTKNYIKGRVLLN